MSHAYKICIINVKEGNANKHGGEYTWHTMGLFWTKGHKTSQDITNIYLRRETWMRFGCHGPESTTNLLSCLSKPKQTPDSVAGGFNQQLNKWQRIKRWIRENGLTFTQKCLKFTKSRKGMGNKWQGKVCIVIWIWNNLYQIMRLWSVSKEVEICTGAL